MNIQANLFSVNNILFESNDNEVLIKGNLNKGHMNFETEFIINHTQLNIILNVLQSQNNDITVHDAIETEKMYDGETLYSADFTDLEFNKFDLNTISSFEQMRQIRA